MKKVKEKKSALMSCQKIELGSLEQKTPNFSSSDFSTMIPWPLRRDILPSVNFRMGFEETLKHIGS